jgi:alpha-L-rhamnosidase
LTSASSDLTTAYGRTRSSWTRGDGKLTLQVTIPPNATGVVRLQGVSEAPAEAVALGGGSYFVPSGSYSFTAT